MAKTEKNFTELEWDPVDDINILDEVEPEDFVFVVRANGMVKSVLFPEVGNEDGSVSEGIQNLMDYFSDQFNSSSVGQTLH